MMNFLFRRSVPIVSFLVGSAALSFQVFILYPWHNELASEFKKVKELKEQQDSRLEEYNVKKMDKVHEI